MTEQRRRLEPLRLDPRRGPGQTGMSEENLPTPNQTVGTFGSATPPAHTPPTSSERLGIPTWVVAVIAGTVVVVLLTIGLGAVLLRRGDDQRSPPMDRSKPPAATTTPPIATNDGTDANRPILPDVDKAFVDTRGGWGWGDRCWISMKAGKWGWAKAECDQGMAMNPASPQPRASLLYNEGLVAKAAGRMDEARMDFTSSLALRENAEVRSALNSLGR